MSTRASNTVINIRQTPFIFSVANSASEQSNIPSQTANGAFLKANGAFDAANNVAPQIEPAFTKANSAYLHANAAFNSANNVAPQIEPAFKHANASFNVANTKLSQTGGTVNGDLAITGNLIVSGSTVEISTANVFLQDNIITINSDLPNNTLPIDNSGLEVNRGSSQNVSIIWNENRDRWTFTNDGITFDDIEGTSRLNNNPILNRSEYIQANNTINFNVAITANGQTIAGGGLSPFLFMGA